MAFKCEKCGKGVMSGMNVSHSNRHTKTIFRPNLQNVTVFENGQNKKMRLCTRCIRSLHKTPKIRTKKVKEEAAA